ncbi:TPA: type II toxin-antitoxin system prevent-host-death family antitoxin [Candidatus Poribacteria bacterium]|nr:type II toxin-antitoxin system prevent-host-death family antitoxin [Candidatus Poribacteria bacterium]
MTENRILAGVDFKISMIDNHLIFQVSIDEIEQDLPAYIRRVESGETIVIVKTGKPIAEIKPVVSTSKRLRPFGLCSLRSAVTS